MQEASVRAAIVGLGHELGPAVLQGCMALYREDQARLAATSTARVTLDEPYGVHARQRLDVYAPFAAGRTPSPTLVWVHGGGFVRGEKRSPDHPFNAHVGHWAARAGWLGLVINYRLAPECQWPSGGEDVAAVVAWARTNAARYGGDPDRLVLAGTSAGSAHVATFLQRNTRAEAVRAAVLLSGLYGATPLDRQDHAYYGSQSVQPQQAALEAVASSKVPLFVACAQFDPSRFQAETLALLQRVLAVRGRVPRAHFASGHNHYTLAMHLGTADTRLADEILSFVDDTTR